MCNFSMNIKLIQNKMFKKTQELKNEIIMENISNNKRKEGTSVIWGKNLSIIYIQNYLTFLGWLGKRLSINYNGEV